MSSTACRAHWLWSLSFFINVKMRLKYNSSRVITPGPNRINVLAAAMASLRDTLGLGVKLSVIQLPMKLENKTDEESRLCDRTLTLVAVTSD